MIRALAIAALLATLAWAATDTRAGLVMAPTGASVTCAGGKLTTSGTSGFALTTGGTSTFAFTCSP